MVRNEELLKSAKKGKVRAGRKELIKYLEGTRLTRQQAIKAKCYDCNGMEEFGDCNQEGCVLLLFSPYNRQDTHFSRARKAKKGIVEAKIPAAKPPEMSTE